jgi:hypothetical protein
MSRTGRTHHLGAGVALPGAEVHKLPTAASHTAVLPMANLTAAAGCRAVGV